MKRNWLFSQRLHFEHWFLSGYARGSLIQTWRLRFALYCGTLLVFVLLVGSLMASIKVTLSLLFPAIVGLLGVLLAVMMHKAVRAWLVIDLLLLLLVGGVLYLHLSGTSSPIAFWLVLVPLFATLLRGPWGGFLWTCIISVVLLCLFAFVWTVPGLVRIPEIFGHSWPVSVVIAYFALFSFYGIGLLAERSMAQLMSMAEAKNRALQDQIRQRKEAERQLHTTLQHRDRLFAVVSHDLKGPLGSLKELFALLDSAKAHEQIPIGPNEIHIIHSQLSNLYEMTNTLLQWSRSQFKISDAIRLDTDVCRVVYEELELLAMQTAKKRIAFTLSGLLFKLEPVVCKIDANTLRVVTRNLVQNAIKFSPPSSEVAIALELEDEKIALHVSDRGKGLPPQLQGELSNLAPIASTEGSLGEKGHGIGLSLCLDLLARDGGRLVGNQPEGGGSELVAYLTIEASADGGAFLTQNLA